MYACLYVCTYTYVYMHACMFVCFICMYKSRYVCQHKVYTYQGMYVRINARMYAVMYVYGVHIHIRI